MIKYPNLYKIDSKGKIRVYFIELEANQYRMVTGVLDGNLVRSKWTTAKPKNVGRSNETTAEEQAISEVDNKYTKKQNEGYFSSLEDANNNPDGKFFQPMLATEWDKIKEKDRKFPYIADPKLDGMRMTNTMTEAISRKGKPIPTVPHIISALDLLLFYKKNPTIRLDGEIYNHEYREDFNTLMSVARRANPDEADLKLSAEKLEYHVYDLFDSSKPDLTALERKHLLDLIVSTGYPGVELVDWELVYNEEELELIKQRHLREGYEGTILRSPDEPYHNKRTKHLIKIKEFITEEFTGVSGDLQCVIPGKGNKSDIAGSIVVMVDDVIVNCGIRGSWKYCKTLLDNQEMYQGATVTVRHFGKTPDGSLRFPVCIDINRPD